MSNQINWGIIGCGEVTERKSGPAFQKVNNSALVAVMRRDEEKARDYAQRHGVARYYTRASDLIHDPQVNAVYIATPPGSHEELAMQALAAGKPVYVEKPIALSGDAAQRMAEMSKRTRVPLTVAHYRRAQPYFQKIKFLLDSQAIGQPRVAEISMHRRALTAAELDIPRNAWRVDPKISGGGLFHDLSPHQLDLFLHWFGSPLEVKGIAYNQAALYAADDTVACSVRFGNGLLLQGSWCFAVDAAEETDECRITGTEGSLSFAFFDRQEITLRRHGVAEKILFEPLMHVQEPMIDSTVAYFMGKGPNPCSADEAAAVMRLIDEICAKG